LLEVNRISDSPIVIQSSSFSSPSFRFGVDHSGKGCGREKLQPVIAAVVAGLRTLMKDAREGSIR